MVFAASILGCTACDVNDLLWDVPTGYGDTDADFTYHIQECERFDHFDCLSGDVDEVTHLFETSIKPKFVGERLHDGSSDCLLAGEDCPLPSHVAESTEMFGNVQGQDDQYADSAEVFLFAGHGGSSTPAGPALAYTILDPGNPNAGCNPLFHHHIKLGRLGGAKTRIGIYAASCVGAGHWHDSGLWTSWQLSFDESASWQHLAFLDSPSILDDELEDFAGLVRSGVDNNMAWRTALEINSDYSSWNQPITITRGIQGESPETVTDRASDANFYTMHKLPPPGGATGFFLVDDTFSFDLFDPIPSGCDFY